MHPGDRRPEDVRTVRAADALVDTGATGSALPASMIRQLRVTTSTGTERARNTTGVYRAKISGPVRLTIPGRDYATDVAEPADESPVLIGQLPPEYFQLVVDLADHRLVPSPANGGEWVLDMFGDTLPPVTARPRAGGCSGDPNRAHLATR